MTAFAISVQNVQVGIGQHTLLHSVDAKFRARRWTAIVGPNGAGKSTLLQAMAGLHASQNMQGHVRLFDRPLFQWPVKERARTLSWLGQSEGASPDLSCQDVVMLGRLPHQAWLGTPGAADHAAVEHALRSTQTWNWRHRPLAQLSGGERQRVLLARALAVQAQVLLMDEPLANLDPPHQSAWMETVQSLVAGGHTVVSVLHELGIALQSDDLLIMQAGRVLHHGPTADRATHAALEAVFDHCIRVRQVDSMWMALPQKLMKSSDSIDR